MTFKEALRRLRVNSIDIWNDPWFWFGVRTGWIKANILFFPFVLGLYIGKFLL